MLGVDFLLGPIEGFECRIGPHLFDKVPKVGWLPPLAQTFVLALGQKHGKQAYCGG